MSWLLMAFGLRSVVATFCTTLNSRLASSSWADELAELEVLEDLAGVRGEAVDVGEQVALDVGAAQLGQVHRRGVVEGLPGGLEQELLAGVLLQLLHGLAASDLLEDLRLAAAPARTPGGAECERQDDAPVLGLLEVAAQQVGEGPDIGGGCGKVFNHVGSPVRPRQLFFRELNG